MKAKVFSLEYKKANGERKDYFIAVPVIALFTVGKGGFVAKVYSQLPSGAYNASPNEYRRFNWEGVECIEPLHESLVNFYGLETEFGDIKNEKVDSNL